MLPVINAQRFKIKFPHSGVELEYRPMLLAEEKIIVTAKDIGNDGEKIGAIRQIVEACIVSEYDVKQLTTFELEFVFIHIFKRSKGEELNVNFKCPKCSERTPLAVNLDDVSFKYNESHTRTIYLTDGVGVVFNYPDFSLVEKLGNAGDSIENNIQSLISMVDCVYDENTTYDFRTIPNAEKEAFFNQLTFKQFESIGEFIKTMPRVVAEVQAGCEKCGHTQEVIIEGLLNFLA